MTLVLTSVGSFTRNLRVALFMALIECTCKHAANIFHPTMDSQQKKYLNRNPNVNWQLKTSSLFTNITSTSIQSYWNKKFSIRIFLKKMFCILLVVFYCGFFFGGGGYCLKIWIFTHIYIYIYMNKIYNFTAFSTVFTIVVFVPSRNNFNIGCKMLKNV